MIMKDKTTNQSRGFGFVKFKDPNCVGTVLASRPHTLDGRNVSVLPQSLPPNPPPRPCCAWPLQLRLPLGLRGAHAKGCFSGVDLRGCSSGLRLYDGVGRGLGVN